MVDREGPDEVDREVVLAQRMVVLSNLVKVGGGAGRPGSTPPGEQDLATLSAMLDAGALPAEARAQLREAFVQPRQHPVDFDVFRGDDARALIGDLATLGRRAGRLRDAERRYIRQVAHKLGIGPAQADALIGADGPIGASACPIGAGRPS